MASSIGSATVAPIARRKVRRGNAFFATNIGQLASRIWNGRLFTTPSTSDASV